ncbi:hypothetical protein BU15DRAFT_70184 [Melanogaster broomeanus]|nr:hypothetical protein BU15DRAFT_70184 [Melanogaster broomeanus]
MVVEDDIDTETLQAQIDMSMSFAHNLVTSWIKPAQVLLRSNGTNATQILEEELRRPPRLGVGAPIPTMLSEAREPSKLKRRLMKIGGKNESLRETATQTPPKTDDEEHKGRPTKRKTKVDPFAFEGSKKRRKDNSISASLPPEAGQQRGNEGSLPKDEAICSKNIISREHSKHDSSLGKGKQRSEPDDLTLLGCSRQESAPLTSPRPVQLSTRVQSPLSPSWMAPTLGPPSDSSRKSASPVPGTPLVDRVHSKELRFPLLNLDGPPEFSDKLGNATDPNNSRKKRKRRKKKKAQTSTGKGDN